MASQKRFRTKEAHQKTTSEGQSRKGSSKPPLTKPDSSRVYKTKTEGSSYRSRYRGTESKVRSVRKQQADPNYAKERFWEVQDREQTALPGMSHSQPSKEMLEMLEADQQPAAGNHTPRASSRIWRQSDQRSQSKSPSSAAFIANASTQLDTTTNVESDTDSDTNSSIDSDTGSGSKKNTNTSPAATTSTSSGSVSSTSSGTSSDSDFDSESTISPKTTQPWISKSRPTTKIKKTTKEAPIAVAKSTPSNSTKKATKPAPTATTKSRSPKSTEQVTKPPTITPTHSKHPTQDCWLSRIQRVETIKRSNFTGRLNACVVTSTGKYLKVPAEDCNKLVPQLMIEFYEKHTHFHND